MIRDLRESVNFTQVNLVDAASMAAPGTLRRHLLPQRADLFRRRLPPRRGRGHLHDALEPGGFLCLGHTESMARISDRFTMRRFEDAIVYQRPKEA